MEDDKGDQQLSVHTLCRTCLELLANKNFYNLFLTPGLAKKLIVCTSLSVESQDGYPKNICESCYTQLNQCAQFQKMCVDSVQKFQEMIGNETSNKPLHLLEPESIATAEKPIVHVDTEEPNLQGEESNDMFDPLISSKLEIITNEEEVVKMLDQVKRGKDPFDEQEFSSESSMSEMSFGDGDANNNSDDGKSDGNSSDDDFNANDGGGSDFSSDSSDDDVPLSKRIKKNSDTKKTPVKTRKEKTYITEPIECKICHKKFNQNNLYDFHMKYHNPDLPYQCQVENCQMGFTTPSALTKHNERFHSEAAVTKEEPELLHRCTAEGCVATFTTSSGLNKHIDRVHPELTTCIPCTEEGCTETFTRSRQLAFHLRKVHNKAPPKSNKVYTCPDCGKVYKCPVALKKHSYKHNGKELPFGCNICGKRFLVNIVLKEHLMRHAGIKNYVCPYCGLGFTSKPECNKHINTHTREKTFKCPQCDHSTHTKHLLNRHIRVIHDKIKKYICQYCSKAFSQSNTWRNHEKLHTGERPYECQICDKNYIYASDLKKHLRSHENKAKRALKREEKNALKMEKTAGKKKRRRRKKIYDADGNFVMYEPPKNPEENQMANVADPTNPLMAATDILKVCEETMPVIVKQHKPRVERISLEHFAGTFVNPIPAVDVPGVPIVNPNWTIEQNQDNQQEQKPKQPRNFRCTMCTTTFVYEHEMKRHIKIVHEKIKDFACRFCPKRFGKSDHLKVHERRHTGEKPYACHICGKAFVSTSEVKNHVQQVHKPKNEAGQKEPVKINF